MRSRTKQYHRRARKCLSCALLDESRNECDCEAVSLECGSFTHVVFDAVFDVSSMIHPRIKFPDIFKSEVKVKWRVLAGPSRVSDVR